MCQRCATSRCSSNIRLLWIIPFAKRIQYTRSPIDISHQYMMHAFRDTEISKRISNIDDVFDSICNGGGNRRIAGLESCQPEWINLVGRRRLFFYMFDKVRTMNDVAGFD